MNTVIQEHQEERQGAKWTCEKMCCRLRAAGISWACRSFVWVWTFLVLTALPLIADPNASFFGDSQSIYGDSFHWTGAYEWPANDDQGNTYHHDFYSDGGGGTITVEGYLSNADLASVWGTTSQKQRIYGYFLQGAFNDSSRSGPPGTLPSSYTNSYANLTYSWTGGYTNYSFDYGNQSIVPVGYVDYYSVGNGGPSFCTNVDASVTGGVQGSESGYVINSGFDINYSYPYYSPQSGIGDMTFFGHDYNFSSGLASVIYNPGGSQSTSYSDSYSSAGGNATYNFTDNNTSSGSWSGWDASVGNWVADSSGTITGNSAAPFNGTYYTFSATNGSATVPYSWKSGISMGTIAGGETYYNDTYLGRDGTTFFVAYSYDGTQWNGTIYGAQQGYVVNSAWYVNSWGYTHTPYSGKKVYSIFGDSFHYSVSTYHKTYDSDGSEYINATDSYLTGIKGGSVAYSYNSDPSNGSSGTWSGWEPQLGAWSLDSNGIFGPRKGPSFTGKQLWVDNVLTTWQSGTLQDGINVIVTDIYSGFDSSNNVVTVTIQGNVIAFGNSNALSPSPVNVMVFIYGTAHGGTCINNAATPFNVPGLVLFPAAFSRGTPHYLPKQILYVNNTPYKFKGGVDDSGFSVDVYSNSSVGTLELSGATASTTATVNASYFNNSISGNFNVDGQGSFDISGGTVATTQIDETGGVHAFWVAGRLYVSTPDSGDYLFQNPDTGMKLTATYSFGNVMISGSIFISGTYTPCDFAGIWQLGSGGIFTCVRSDTDAPIPVCPVNADGSLMLGDGDPPTDFPPAVAVNSQGVQAFWTFLGTASDDVNLGEQAAYYGNVLSPGPGGSLLKITSGGDVMPVTVTDYIGNSSVLGTYDTQSHLFQTTFEQQPLPMPINGVSPPNNAIWGLQSPPAGRPGTVFVGGDVWRYVGTDQNGDNYVGYYSGETITFGATGRDGAVAVTLVDPVRSNLNSNSSNPNGNNYTFTGLYFNGGFTMSHGAPTVNAGDNTGTSIVAPSDGIGKLRSITGDLDINGGLFSLGSWNNNPNMAGLSLQYTETFTLPDGSVAGPPGSPVGLVGFASSRQYTSWLWGNATIDGLNSTLPVMMLNGADHSLKLFDPANPSVPQIILNPTPGGSFFSQPLRVAPQGDLDMGKYTASPKPAS